MKHQRFPAGSTARYPSQGKHTTGVPRKKSLISPVKGLFLGGSKGVTRGLVNASHGLPFPLKSACYNPHHHTESPKAMHKQRIQTIYQHHWLYLTVCSQRWRNFWRPRYSCDHCRSPDQGAASTVGDVVCQCRSNGFAVGAFLDVAVAEDVVVAFWARFFL